MNILEMLARNLCPIDKNKMVQKPSASYPGLVLTMINSVLSTKGGFLKCRAPLQAWEGSRKDGGDEGIQNLLHMGTSNPT